MQEKLKGLGLVPTVKSAQEFDEIIKHDTERFAKLVKDIGYEPR